MTKITDDKKAHLGNWVKLTNKMFVTLQHIQSEL